MLKEVQQNLNTKDDDEYKNRVAKSALITLPIDELQGFASENYRLFCKHVRFNECKLEYARSRETSLLEQDEWSIQELGNIAYMSEHSPPEFKERWLQAFSRFVELHS